MILTRVRVIIRAASAVSGYSECELTGRGKRRDLVVWRQAVMLLASRAGHGMPHIGRVLNRDHTCVVHVLYRLTAEQRERVENAAARIEEYMARPPGSEGDPSQLVLALPEPPPGPPPQEPPKPRPRAVAYRRIAHWYGDVWRTKEADAMEAIP